MSQKNNRIACSDPIKLRFDKVGAILTLETDQKIKFGHDEILDYLISLHESNPDQIKQYLISKGIVKGVPSQ